MTSSGYNFVWITDSTNNVLILHNHVETDVDTIYYSLQVSSENKLGFMYRYLYLTFFQLLTGW